VNVQVGAKSDVGRVRQANEDSYLLDEPLFVVADGMGGHIAGDVASSTAVETIEKQSSEASPDDMETLVRLVRSANSRIWEKAQGDPTLKGMGTTCTLLLLDGARAHFAHVGDSRAYLLRGNTLTQVTEDHSLVGRLVKEGRLTLEEAENHPQRSIITRALGVDPEVEVDLLTVDLAPGDRIVMCSDGLSSMIGSDAMTTALTQTDDPQAAADRLVELANEAGGEDNITVVVLDILDTNGGAKADGGWKRNDTLETAPPSAPSVPSSSEMTGAVMAPAPPREQVAQQPPPAYDADDEGYDEHPARTWPRKLVLALVVVAVLGVAAFFGGRYLLRNSWYVGVNDDGFVTLYEGIPEEIAGLTLDKEIEVTDIRPGTLPDFLADNIADGIKKDSLEEARQQISTIEDQAEADDAQRNNTNAKD
jgi:serine/threonine protein phosphatase PrpC